MQAFTEALKLQRSYGPCFECGQPAFWRHHVIPQSRGGTKTVPLCGACHGLVHDTKRTDDHSRLIKEGLQRAKARGMKLGRTQRVSVEIGRRIVRERELGASLHEIARGLNSDGVPTARAGKEWYAATIRGVLLAHEDAAAA